MDAIVFVSFILLYQKEKFRKKIKPQTKNFSFFPASVPIRTVSKILQDNCVKTTTKYLPARYLWIKIRFIELANRNDWICLTID